MNPQAPSTALTTGNSGNLSRFGGGESMGSGGFSGLSGFLGQSRTIASQRRDLVSSSMYNSAMGAATIRAVANGSSSSASSVLANQNQPITYFIWMRLAFPSDSDNLCKGSPLWFNCTEDDLAGMKPLGLTVTSLNYVLEKSARDNAASAAAFQMPSDDEDEDAEDGAERRLKRLRSDLPSFDGFDQEVIDRRTNVKQLDMLYVANYNPDAPRELNGSDETVFTRKFYYGGFVQHIEGKLIRGEKVMTVAVARHMELPNCWGHVNEGSVLGYMAKWVTRPIYSAFLDQNGVVVWANAVFRQCAGPEPVGRPFLDALGEGRQLMGRGRLLGQRRLGGEDQGRSRSSPSHL